MLIIAVILLLFVLLFMACVTGDKYYTYELSGAPTSYKTEFFRSYFYYIGQNLYIDSTVKNDRYLTLDLRLRERGIIDNGTMFLDEFSGKRIFTEPYSLNMYLWLSSSRYIRDADKIIFNKLHFLSKNNAFDLRQNIDIIISGYRHGGSDSEYYHFNKEEIMDFRNSGIIDLEKLKQNEWREINGINIYYDKIDVIFKKDSYFALEFDVTVTSNDEDHRIDNYSSIARFNRKRYTETESLLGYLLGTVLFSSAKR